MHSLDGEVMPMSITIVQDNAVEEKSACKELILRTRRKNTEICIQIETSFQRQQRLWSIDRINSS